MEREREREREGGREGGREGESERVREGGRERERKREKERERPTRVRAVVTTPVHSRPAATCPIPRKNDVTPYKFRTYSPTLTTWQLHAHSGQEQRQVCGCLGGGSHELLAAQVRGQRTIDLLKSTPCEKSRTLVCLLSCLSLLYRCSLTHPHTHAHPPTHAGQSHLGV